jgi:prepilin-type N-terminal cleavage/methylation domain-containing protein
MNDKDSHDADRSPVGRRRFFSMKPMAPKSRHIPGFTLIELLVVIAIVAGLTAILLPALGAARDTAKSVQTLAAVQQTMQAYTARSTDNKDQLLYGYLPFGPVVGEPTTVTLPTGAVVSSLTVQRYPLRLAEYQGDAWEMIFIHQEIPEVPGPADPNLVMNAYELGLTPTLGLNTTFVGGDRRLNGFAFAGNGQFAPNRVGPAIFKMHEARRPSELLVFTETQQFTGTPSEVAEGYHLAEPPVLNTRLWSAQGNEIVLANPGSFGVPMARFGSGVPTGFLDGHAEAMVPTELDDMRLWENDARDPETSAYFAP